MGSLKGGESVTLTDGEGGQAKVFCYQDIIFPGSFPDWFNPKEKLESIKRFQYREGDILQCSFPKSGNHWLTNLLTFLLSKGSVGTATSVNVNLIDLSQPTERLHTKPSPRIITSHLKFKYLPDEHLKRGKMILLVRNPKDVAVSYYCHGVRERMMKTTLSWESYLKYFCEGKLSFGSYFEYLNDWQKVLQQRKDLNIHIVYYEDLLEQPLLELQRLQKFLDVHNDDDRLHQIIRKCSFSSLKSDVDIGKVKTILKDENNKPYLYRKGVIGSWMSHFTVAQNKAFDTLIENKLRDSMFRFRYTPKIPKHRL